MIKMAKKQICGNLNDFRDKGLLCSDRVEQARTRPQGTSHSVSLNRSYHKKNMLCTTSHQYLLYPRLSEQSVKVVTENSSRQNLGVKKKKKKKKKRKKKKTKKKKKTRYV